MSSQADARTVAFLGLGLMGAPMAARLIAAGFSVAVWNRSPDKSDALTGAIICPSPAEAVRDAGIVCLCLTDAAAVDQVVFGPNGCVGTIGSTAILIDFSTIGVAPTRNFAARLAERTGAAWLDCPVSGGVAGAAGGTLTIFAGGDPDAFARAAPVIEAVAARSTLLGEIGSGQAAKLCNQLIVSANLLAIAEAIALGERLGLDAARLPAALAGGFADSKPLQIFGPRMAPPADPGPPVSALRTMKKDIDAVLAAADAAGLAPPLLRQVEASYAQAVHAGMGDDDLPALVRLYRP